MRILLTGASGFVGGRLVRALLAQGHDVVCAVRSPRESSDPRLSYVHADFTEDTEKSVWLARLGGVETVINTVGIFREQGRQTFRTVHVDAARALFDACVDAGVKTVIQFSALGADAGARTAYHRSKKAADDHLASLPLRSFIVQPSLIYGSGGASARFFNMLASLPLTLRFGSARQLVQPVHVDDVVHSVVALVRQPAGSGAGNASSVVPLVGPQAMPFADYLAALRRAMGIGSKLRVLPLPDYLAHGAAKMAGYVPGSLLDEDALAMLDRDSTADPAVIARLLGREPRPVSQFIADPPAQRARARLDWLLPPLRWSIAFVWIWTAIVSAGLYPVEESYELLTAVGVPAALAPLMLYGASGLDLAFGVGILVLRGRLRRLLWLAQAALILFYSVVIGFMLPDFLFHPYGPLSKNLPMLAAIWLLYECEDE